MKISNFGIPMSIDDRTLDLTVTGATYEDLKKKKRKDMAGLLYDPRTIEDGDGLAYSFYSIIILAKDKQLFEHYGYTNGVTILQAGVINGECIKNSGHFHIAAEGHRYPNTEVYEILFGKAVFLLQKSRNFMKHDEEIILDDCKMVFLSQGEKIIVPPFYAHCAVNVGEGPMVFGNLAAPCELDYSPITAHHGFFTYVMKAAGELKFINNTHYKQVPACTKVKTAENLPLGIDFNRSLYECFVANPDTFRYLDHPDDYLEDLEKQFI